MTAGYESSSSMQQHQQMHMHHSPIGGTAAATTTNQQQQQQLMAAVAAAAAPKSLTAANNMTINSHSCDASRGFNGAGDVIGGQLRPPVLKLPEDPYWNVYITCVHSTTNVGLRLLGDSYSTEFDDLVTNMELHYFEWDKMPAITQPIVLGRLYAAKVEGDWHRVEVTNVKSDEITCYFIDHGDEEVSNADDLREIDPKFLKLAPQAKHA